MKTAMGDWLNDDSITDTKITDSTFTHVGVSCSCDKTDTVRCVMIMGHDVIGKDITGQTPSWMTVTSLGSCAAQCSVSFFEDSKACSYDEYKNPSLECVECSSIEKDCQTCEYDSGKAKGICLSNIPDKKVTIVGVVGIVSNWAATTSTFGLSLACLLSGQGLGADAFMLVNSV